MDAAGIDDDDDDDDFLLTQHQYIMILDIIAVTIDAAMAVAATLTPTASAISL